MSTRGRISWHRQSAEKSGATIKFKQTTMNRAFTCVEPPARRRVVNGKLPPTVRARAKFRLAVMLLASSFADGLAQIVPLPTSYQVNVNAAGQNIAGDAANEPSMCIDPTNLNRMAVGWRQFDTTNSSLPSLS